MSVFCHSHRPSCNKEATVKIFFPFFLFPLSHKPKALLLLSLIWAHFSTSAPAFFTSPAPEPHPPPVLSRAVPRPPPPAPAPSPSGLPSRSHAPSPREGAAHAQCAPLPGRPGVGGVGAGGGGAGAGGYLGGGALTRRREGEKVHSGRPQGCACARRRAQRPRCQGAGRREVSGSLLGGGVGGGRRGTGPRARARALAAALLSSPPPAPHTHPHAHTPSPASLPARRPPRRPRSPSRARKGVARRRSGGHVALRRRRRRRPRPGLRSGAEDGRWAGGRGRPGRRLLLEHRGSRAPAAGWTAEAAVGAAEAEAAGPGE